MRRSSSSERRNGVVSAFGVVLLVVLGTVVAPPGVAEAASKEFVEFDDGTKCEVSMQDVHASRTVQWDVSVAVDIRCRPPNGGPKDKQLDERVTAETTIAYSKYPPIPGFLSGDPIGTCPRQTKAPHNWGTITCHQVSGDAGYYVGTSNVTVTHLGVTEESDVSRVNTITPPA